MRNHTMKIVLTLLPLALLAVFSCSRANLKKSYNLYEMGNESFRRGDFIQAFSDFYKAKELNPKDPDIEHMIGLTLFARYGVEGSKDYLKQSEEHLLSAIKKYGRFETPDGQDFGRLSLSEAEVNLASIYIEMGRFDEAIERATRAAQDPLYRSPDKANYNIGSAYFQKRQPLKALSFLELSVKQNRRFAGGYKTLGEVYLNLRKYPQAIENLRLATELYPKYAEAYYLMGTAYQKQNRRVTAGKFFRKCNEIDPKGKFGLKCKELVR